MALLECSHQYTISQPQSEETVIHPEEDKKAESKESKEEEEMRAEISSSEHSEQHMAELDLYIAKSEDDQPEQEEEEQVPDNLPHAVDEMLPEEDMWPFPACGNSPCDFLEFQEELDRV
jgi:hypothetical protein